MKTLTIRKPDDFHLHLRQGDTLAKVLPQTTASFARALVMPNTLPPILTADDLTRYRKEILATLPSDADFTPLMTFKVVSSTTPEMIDELKKAGAIAGKLYPEGVTTNSEDGVSDFSSLNAVFKRMDEVGLVLCLHGEKPGVFSLDRESAFLTTLETIAKDFPNLKIVLEHISTAESARLVKRLPKNVAATITVHHLAITLDDVIGDKLNPHNFCKPIVKRPEDREFLLETAKSGDPKFFLGTDSAPHPIASKECSSGAAGVFTAPVALAVLASLFEKSGSLEKLEDFTSTFGARFYGLPLNKDTITLTKKSWLVSDTISSFRPFMANQQLEWEISL